MTTRSWRNGHFVHWIPSYLVLRSKGASIAVTITYELVTKVDPCNINENLENSRFKKHRSKFDTTFVNIGNLYFLFFFSTENIFILYLSISKHSWDIRYNTRLKNYFNSWDDSTQVLARTYIDIDVGAGSVGLVMSIPCSVNGGCWLQFLISNPHFLTT